MEIGENVENKKNPQIQQLQQQLSAASSGNTLHVTQSQPIISSGGGEEEEEYNDNGDHAKAKKKESSNAEGGNRKDRRVSFASSSQLAQYLEPLDPFQSFAIPIANAQELSHLYRLSCEKHKTRPIPVILEHLESLNLEKSAKDRTEVLSLRQQTLSHESCEALEELFKRVKYRAIDVTACNLDDSSSTSLFDMIEYYEACNELNISENPNIKNRGWQSCINMIKRSQALHSLATRGTLINDSNATALGNALSSSFIYTLKLENCGLSGRPILCLSGALQKNRVLKELCLANNELNSIDAFNIGNILKNNYHLQLLDISNNNIQDEGFRHIAEALGYQSVHVSKTSSADSISSASINKFDFNDFTTNLNNINNNRNRFSPTPPPLKGGVVDSSNIHHRQHMQNENVSSLKNNNSILQQCDSNEGVGVKSSDNNGSDEKRETKESAMPAIASTNKNESTLKTNKFKYTTESLSPISHGYDDLTTNHELFNARSPERSFSSESLCSETSVESNDSKSSIRLIESKFSNRNNGTLERQQNNTNQQQQNFNTISTSTQQKHQKVTTSSNDEKPPTGLQVLILWNNNLTSACSASAADLLECTEYLQIINFGHNAIGNEFLIDTKTALKSNESLTSMGMQATNLSCEGIKILAEILQFGGNSTLQRIDLRNNNVSVPGLTALNEALKSNKSIIRIDLDDLPKSDEMLLPYSEYQRLVSTIRQQCQYNDNPPEVQEMPKATTTVQRMKRTNNNFSTRKISLTCSSVIKAPPKNQQLLEPIKKQANNRLRSPSPTLSPSSPLTSPSRSRFQVSRVSESSTSSGISSKSPSSSSSSPTFFPSNSRFRVVTVSEPQVRKEILPPKVIELKTTSEVSKEIDIPAPSSKNISAGGLGGYYTSTSSSIASSQSCEQLDSYEVKRFIDLGDSCSSFSSSIDSIDRQTDISSNESFDMIEKSPLEKPPPSPSISLCEHATTEDNYDKTPHNNQDLNECKKESVPFSNENTLTVSTSSSSSSNEGLTLTTNSPTELSPKQEANKRTRKTSWIQSAIGGSNAKEGSTHTYPATLDKLLNLFHHPASIFTKTSPESTLASSPSSSSSLSSKPPLKTISSSSEMGQKENSITGFIHSLVSLTSHKKESSSETSILQNISPENTIEKSSSNSQILLESLLPKDVKKELKENISPENTISCENFAAAESHKSHKPPLGSKVLFLVGDDEMSIDENASNTKTEEVSVENDGVFHSLGEITRDSMSQLKPSGDLVEKH